MTVGVEVAKVKAAIPTLATTSAVFIGADGSQAIVQFESGQRWTMPNASGTWPQTGDEVFCVNLDGTWWMLGATRLRSELGAVVSVSATTAVVEFPANSNNFGTFQRPSTGDLFVGQTVLLNHSYGGLIVSAYGQPPQASEPPEAQPKPTAKTKTVEFQSTWSDTVYPNGYWSNSTLMYLANRSGGANYGVFGYGNAIKNAIPAGREVTDAAIYLQLETAGGAHQIGAHNLTGKTGVPSPFGAFTVEPKSGWFSLPGWMGGTLIGGGAQQGIVIFDPTGPPGSVYRGQQLNPAMHGRIRITYR